MSLFGKNQQCPVNWDFRLSFRQESNNIFVANHVKIRTLDEYVLAMTGNGQVISRYTQTYVILSQ